MSEQSFIQLPSEQRRLLCNEAQTKLGLHAVSVEKDFWVCWTLNELFQLPEWGAHFTFKGGTSLAKGWKFIERFSEDIDVVIDRDFLGFGGDRGPEHASSKKQQRVRLDELKAECQKRIRHSLLPALSARFKSLLPLNMVWRLQEDVNDPDGQSLLFFYPRAIETAAYVQPVVKIELGARSDTEPSERPRVQSYLAEAFPQIIGSDAFLVRAVAPHRTFWEKAMLLHEETFRPEEKSRKARLARHYYDLWSLINKGVAAQAIGDLDLFKRIAAHREIFFRWSWVDYKTLRPGSLRLVPPHEQLAFWRQDYQSMRDEMFFGEVPKFNEILSVVDDFEKRFNQSAVV
jgi:hypothetical protein